MICYIKINLLERNGDAHDVLPSIGFLEYDRSLDLSDCWKRLRVRVIRLDSLRSRIIRSRCFWNKKVTRQAHAVNRGTEERNGCVKVKIDLPLVAVGLLQVDRQTFSMITLAVFVTSR